MGKWPLGLIGGGALIFFVGLSLGHSPVAVLGAIIFLIGILLAKLFYGPGYVNNHLLIPKVYLPKVKRY